MTQTAVKRYSIRRVTLESPEHGRLVGTQFTRYPVDEPPLIEIDGTSLLLYRSVWETRGWAVSEAPGGDPTPMDIARNRHYGLIVAEEERSRVTEAHGKKVQEAWQELHEALGEVFGLAAADVEPTYDWHCWHSPTGRCVFQRGAGAGCLICGGPRERGSL